MNIVETIFRQADPQAIALIHGESEITFAALDVASQEVVTRLESRLENPTAHRIGLDCPNGIAHVVLALGIVRSGKCLIPIASELTKTEREDLIRRTGIEAILHANGELEPRTPLLPPGFPEKKFHALQPAFIRFSSGTTGVSKGIVLSHESLLERISAANRGLQIGPSDRVVWILPMAHHFAVSIILYLWRGAATIIVDSHLAGDILTAARQHRGTVLYGAPFHHALLAAETSGRDWPGLRLAVSTAAALASSTAEAFLARYGVPLTQGLGIIEIGLPFLNLTSARNKPASIGRPQPDFSARLVEGQLQVRGPGMLDAYLTPWQTRQEIAPGGWFATGDLARVDEDGDYYLEGRSHSVINVAGMKCFPEEIEAVLGSHPGVRRVRVTGRPHPKVGTVPVAEIIPHDPAQPPSLAELSALCRRELARYKIPVDYRFVSELPVTASGKIKRNTDA